MSYEGFQDIGTCEECDKKAEIVYIRRYFLGLRWKFFCRKHARQYSKEIELIRR